jgi:hypothetical protein
VEENLRTQANSLLAASQIELNKGKQLELEAQEFMKSQGIAVPVTTAPVKTKGLPRPGVLKYNEFVKDWISKHPEYQAKGKYQAALKEIQRSGNWATVSGTRKKSNLAPTSARVNLPSTPGRVNAKVTLATPITATPIAATPAKTANSTASSATPVTAANSTASSVNSVTPVTPVNSSNMPYTNEGMDDTVGMRKISMNGRNLYLSSDDGVFEREGNSPGDFIGRLVDGKLVEEEAPELPEYS